jgi:MoxR-like ATPase/CheY-like chemotaxis protein
MSSVSSSEDRARALPERQLLCIDPDVGTFSSLARLLGPGFVIRNIPNGDDAIDWARTSRPALIVLSVEPRKVGYAICNKLRRDPTLREVPLILISAEETASTFEQHKKLKSRADEYLLKPLDESELLAKIGGLLGLLLTHEEEIHELDADSDIVLDEGGAAEHAAQAEKAAPTPSEDDKFDPETQAAFAALEAGAAEAPPKADDMVDLRDLWSDDDLPPALNWDPPSKAEGAAPNARKESDGGLAEPQPRNADLEARIRSLESERQTLRKEIEEERERFTQSATFSKEREFLGLREIINKKEKDILDLRDALDAKERQILDHKDKLRELDRSRRDLEEAALGFERNVAAANEKVAELTLRLEKAAGNGVESRPPSSEDSTRELESARLSLATLKSAHDDARLEIQHLQKELADAQGIRQQLAAKDDLLRELSSDASGAPALEADTSRQPAATPNTLEVQLREGPDGIQVRCGGGWTAGYKLSLTEAVERRLRSGTAPHVDVESIGEQLFDALQASPEFAASYRERIALATDRSPLRLVLSMLPDGDDPERTSVAEHCWEALRDRDRERHLGVALDVRLVRSSTALRSPPVLHSRGTLKVVVGFSSPVATDDGGPLPTLSLMNELQAFRDVENLLSTSSRIDLHVMNRVGLDNFADFVGGASILHFSGHGDAGRLMLQSPSSEAQLLTGAAFSQTLSSPLPIAVTLNCCRSGSADDRGGPLPLVCLARGVPVVVAMAGDVSDATALTFAREFYTRVFAGDDMESAMQKARWRLYAERSRQDWFLPTLWTNLDASPAPAMNDGQAAELSDIRIRRQLHMLNAEVAVLRPRVAVLERLGRVTTSEGLTDADRDVLVDVLARELRTNDGSVAERAETLFSDSRRINRLVRRLSSEGGSEVAADRVLTSMERSILPQLGELVGLLPRLLEATTDSQDGSNIGAVQPAVEASGEPLDDHPLTLADEAGAETMSGCVERVLEELALPDRVIERALVNLLSGRHLVLIGPPGTGKSRVAQKLAQVLGYDSLLVTANPDWTTFDVIGGMVPVAQRDRKGRVSVSYAVRPGYIVEAVRRNWTVTSSPARWQRASRPGSKGTWLIIDEMNRAPMDHSFGDLFTALLTRELRVPRVSTGADSATTSTMPIPLDFRLLCTANTADRHLLFQMSEALKRRFAFVEVPASFSDDRCIPDQFIGRIVGQLAKQPQLVALRMPDLEDRLRTCLAGINPLIGRIRAVHPLGTAQVIDAVVSGVVASKYGPSDRALALAHDALVEQAVPALETLPRERLLLLASLLDGTLPEYLRGIAWQSRSLGDDLPESTRSMALELAGYLEAVAPDQWGQSAAALRHAATNGAGLGDLESVLPADAGNIFALAGANPLASALRRIARAS